MMETINTVSITEREIKMAVMLSNGLRPKEIGPELRISDRTVELYVERLRAKFGAKNVTHLIAEMLRKNIIQ